MYRVARFGIPQLIIPILKWLDQLGWAECIESLGCGLKVDSPFAEQKELQHKIFLLLLHPIKKLIFQARARDIQNRVKYENHISTSEDRAYEFIMNFSPNYIPNQNNNINEDAIERMKIRSCIYM
jgi:hypothetical protein